MNPSKNVFSQSELRIPWKLNNRQYDRDDIADEEVAASASSLDKAQPTKRN